MLPLPVANILHHKLGSALSALGVAIGVCMLVTLSGLSRGSLEEVAHRWAGVDAELIVYPARLGDNISTASGGGLAGRDLRLVAELTAGGKPLAQRVAPVYLDRLRIAGQEHNVVGARPADMPMLLGGRHVRSPGRLFDPDDSFARWLRHKLTTPTDDRDAVVDVTAEELDNETYEAIKAFKDHVAECQYQLQEHREDRYHLGSFDLFKEMDIFDPRDLFSLGLILARIECDYEEVVRFGDRLKIYSRVTEVGSSSFTLEHLFVREGDEKVVARGKAILVAFDYKLNQPVTLSPELVEKLSRYRGAPR